MRPAAFRLVLPLAAVLTAAACSPSRNEAPPAAAATQPAEPPAAGTEGTIASPEAPVPDTARAPSASAPIAEAPPAAPVAPPAPVTAAPKRTTPTAPRPPAAPAAPAAPTRDAARDSTPAEAPAVAEREAPRPAPVRMISIPENTRLRLGLQTALGSDTSNVEDRVSARVLDDVVVEGETVIPEGSRVDGRVTYAQASGKVKGRAGLTVRFHTLTIGSRAYDIVTEPVRREAEGSKAKDARNIGIGAGAGAVIGGILGGRKGAGIGAAVGGAGGTGVVLATKGEEVRLPVGTPISTRLSDALVVQLRDER